MKYMCGSDLWQTFSSIVLLILSTTYFIVKTNRQTFFRLNKLQFIRSYNNNYTNNISILKLWAEIFMGRNGHGPIWLWAEMTCDRDGHCS